MYKCRSVVLACGLLGSVLAGNARAADLSAPVEPVVVAQPSLFDVSFGVNFTTDYVLRGITQSSGKPAVQGYTELSLLDWAYIGVWVSSVDLPESRGFSDPSAEVDIYGGLRHSWGALTLDVGYIYYWYPGEKPGFGQSEFGKVYGKASYAFADIGVIGANIYYTTNNVNTGANAINSSITGKLFLPKLAGLGGIGAFTSGEFGRRWAKRNDFGFNPPDYTFWNAGVGFTYKAMTLDLRYHDSDLSRRRCGLAIGVDSWCGDRYVLSLAFDTSLSKLK